MIPLILLSFSFSPIANHIDSPETHLESLPSLFQSYFSSPACLTYVPTMSSSLLSMPPLLSAVHSPYSSQRHTVKMYHIIAVSLPIFNTLIVLRRKPNPKPAEGGLLGIRTKQITHFICFPHHNHKCLLPTQYSSVSQLGFYQNICEQANIPRRHGGMRSGGVRCVAAGRWQDLHHLSPRFQSFPPTHTWPGWDTRKQQACPW